MKGCFVTGTGTEVGKTYIAETICRTLRDAGTNVLGIKPIETGVGAFAEDARRLATACGRPELESCGGLYRATIPVAPLAVQWDGAPILNVSGVAHAVRDAVASHAGDDDPFVVVEGAGGVMVPLNETQTTVDLCQALALPALLVARDQLGTLSHTLTAVAALQMASVPVLAVVLNRFGAEDASQKHNQRILQQFLDLPIWRADEVGARLSATALAG